jgi:hypothetical protein
MSAEATTILQKVEKLFVGTAQQVGKKVARTIAKGASSKVVVPPHFLTRLGGRHTPAPTESNSSSGHSEAYPSLPPDERLNEKMQIIMLQKALYGITMDDFSTTCWSEGDFYKEWLEKDGKHDIVVGDWEIDEVNGFVVTWDQETYSQRRAVTYVYDQEPTSAPIQHNVMKSLNCEQERFCCLNQSATNCTFAVKCWTNGHWYSDVFEIHVRWVITATPVPN